MSNKLFIKYAELARKAEKERGTKESLEWFNRTIRKSQKISQVTEVTDGLKPAKLNPGEMIVFSYMPKYKEKLPYYDMHPLVLLLDRTPDGWFGANIHYLPPKMRADVLFDIQYNRKTLQQIKMALENSEWTKPCLRKYLVSQLLTRPKSVPKEQWDIAIQLPFESFMKASQKEIWRKSKSKI
jgi:hypothetical protein